MTSIAPGTVIPQALQRYVATFDPPKDALHDARRAAFERFCALGFPGPYDESWRQTPGLKAIADTAWAPAHIALSHDSADGGSGRDDTGPVRLGSVVSSDEAFAALNFALHGDALTIEVPDGVEVPHPIQITFLGAGDDRPCELHSRVFVNLGAGAKCSVLEIHDPRIGDQPTFSTHVTEISLGDGAQVEHTVWQQLGPRAHHVAITAADLGRDARVRFNGFTDGGALTRNEVQARFANPGAEAEFNGLLIGRGSDVVDYHTLVHHDTTDTQSRQTYKAILADRARGVFEGQVVIPPGAQRTGATQSNHNLLLSDHAQIHTKPLLEIHADDVQCAHGAAIGQLDEAALFYLRARGIPFDDARRLLIEAFADEVVDAVADDAVRAWLAPRVRAALPLTGAGA